MKGYDLIPNQFTLLQKKLNILQLCKKICKLKKAEFLKLNDKKMKKNLKHF